VSLGDLLDADELAAVAEEERGEGAASAWAMGLQVGLGFGRMRPCRQR
jgi:hypothetical protein